MRAGAARLWLAFFLAVGDSKYAQGHVHVLYEREDEAEEKKERKERIVYFPVSFSSSSFFTIFFTCFIKPISLVLAPPCFFSFPSSSARSFVRSAHTTISILLFLLAPKYARSCMPERKTRGRGAHLAPVFILSFLCRACSTARKEPGRDGGCVQ